VLRRQERQLQLAATAGLVLSGFVGLVDNYVGRGFELDSIGSEARKGELHS
jgi:hypothetical protein